MYTFVIEIYNNYLVGVEPLKLILRNQHRQISEKALVENLL